MNNKSQPAYLYLIMINSLILLVFYITKTFFFKNEIIYLAFGAQYGPLISSGQWYRIITAMFMHGGFLHLGFNMYALYILGNYVEGIYGTYRFLVYYFLSGIIGNIATQIFYYDSLSVGASGAIFGLVGTLFGAGFRKDTPFFLKPITGSALLPMIVLNIILGFVPGSGINNAAHIGGLITGILLGYGLPVYHTYKAERVWKIVAYIIIAIVTTAYGLLVKDILF
ncbi:MAG: rhomboid family intramembrane serine protease [Fervidobacterium sp.]|nr:rhomboid family intramembrane serine protease [Fervidobacterium sp.]